MQTSSNNNNSIYIYIDFLSAGVGKTSKERMARETKQSKRFLLYVIVIFGSSNSNNADDDDDDL